LTVRNQLIAVGERLSLRGLAGLLGEAFLQSPRVVQGAAQKELHLGVEAAEVVGGPALQGCQDLRVDAKKEGLALSHGCVYW
jgi:hypothetical protein